MKLLTQQDCAIKIELLATAAKTVQEDIHLCAVSTLAHTRDHGDYTGAERLLNALPNGQRVKALAFWFSHFSSKKLSFKFDKEASAWVGTLSKTRMESDFGVDGAMLTTFADLTIERDPMSVTVESMVRNLERNAANSEMHEGTNIPKVDPKARELAAQIVQFVKGLKAA